MKRSLFAVILAFISVCSTSYAQRQVINDLQFFTDTAVISATITTDTRKLFVANKKKGFTLPATFSTSLEGKNIRDRILLEIRGNFRLDYCYIPPLKLHFRYDSTAALSSLRSLKLVSGCQPKRGYEQLLLKEYIIYKLYSLLTDKSFRVRLLKLNLADSLDRKKTLFEYAFLMEDIKDLAKRNKCTEWKGAKLHQEATDRRQMTVFSVFEYMIGNTDWSVPGAHNAFLIVSNEEKISPPFAVPYDFDFSGLVGTEYAQTDDKLPIQNVTERLYRGYARTMEEIKEVLEIFKQQKENMYQTISNFDLLTQTSKKEMTAYLDQFFNTIHNNNEVISTFINNVRKD
jgi:hypothetical protein